MDWTRSLRDYLGRKLTILVISQAELKPFRWQCTNAFFAFSVFVWGALTAWSGFVVGRHTDYWITKADNKVMFAKMTQLAQEMDRSREALAMAKATDQQLRVLLSLSRREQDGEALGGPTAGDRASLREMLGRGPGGISQADWHRRIEEIRQESYRRLASFQEIGWYIGNQRTLYHAVPSMWPTEGHITSLFGYRFDPMHTTGETGEYHAGIDIANTADTLIYATADGTARHAGWSHGYGQMVVIDHGYGISTLYGHTSKTLIKTGDRVQRGQVIAYMGTTGRSTGAHLHYEVWRHGKPINPQSFLKVRSAGDMLLTQRAEPHKATGR